MKMLYEKIMAQDYTYTSADDPREKITDVMDRAEIFYIQNVADYFRRTDKGMGNEAIYMTDDFPNVAPPFQEIWMEYKSKLLEIGILILSRKTESTEKADDTKWEVYITPFVYNKEIGIRCPGRDSLILLVDKFGKSKYLIPSPSLTTDELLRYEISLICPALLAISFLHCKNVQVIPQGPSYGGMRHNRDKPKVKYHVLQIEPMKKVLREEGNSEATGLKMALHICRGHFKDYTKGSGLFGHYRDIFWWDSQVRGTPGNGTVLKDYNINAPQSN